MKTAIAILTVVVIGLVVALLLTLNKDNIKSPESHEATTNVNKQDCTKGTKDFHFGCWKEDTTTSKEDTTKEDTTTSKDGVNFDNGNPFT